MITLKKNVFYIGIFIMLIVVVGLSSARAWETPIVIAGKGDHLYEKPEIEFAPSGAVYITYRDRDMVSGNSDIYLCTYDGKEMVYENVSEGHTFFPRYKCYEADVELTEDGRVHVAWMFHNRNAVDTHYVKYRYKDGNTWSEIFELGAIPMPRNDTAFDLRLGVSNNGNVHVTTYREIAADVQYLAKYGDTILPLEYIGPAGGRNKHPDIAVDDDYVHIIWMQKVGFPYAIMHQKWENRLGGTRSDVRQLTFSQDPWSSQKSRITLGSNGLYHFAEFCKSGVNKELKYYKEQPSGSLSTPITVSNPTTIMLYHWAAIAVRDNSVICIMQLGSSSGGRCICYNWQKNGQWGGYSQIPNTDGVMHDSVDLSVDGQIAAVAYQRYDTAIMLVSSAEITATGLLEAEFAHPDTVFWGDNVTFDASQCVDMNRDYNIAMYEWSFGDGIAQATPSPTITHSFDTYGTDVRVTLKIIAETGEAGTTYKDIHIHALYNGIVTSVDDKEIRTLFFNRPANEVKWMANPKNAAAGYSAITSYEIWRAPVSAVMSDSAYVHLVDVNAGVNEYLDYQGVQANVQYVYSIRSVDSEGHISPFGNL